MDHSEVRKTLSGLYKQLEALYQSFADQSVEELGLRKLNKECWSQMRDQLESDFEVEKFKEDFSRLLLRYLNRSKKKDFNSTSDLLQASYFAYDEKIAGNSLLCDITEIINEKVRLFFIGHKDVLERVLQEKLQQQKKKYRAPRKQAIVTEVTNPPVNISNTQALIDLDTNEPANQNTQAPQQMQQQAKPQPNPEPSDFASCVCLTLQLPATQPNKYIQCTECQKYFHISCVKLDKNDLNCYVCAYCTMQQLDLFNQVTEVLVAPQFFKLSHTNTSKTFNFHLKEIPRGHQLQLRCLRVDDYHGLDEITWPDLGEIQVNGTKAQDFKPLPQNTAMKKRKDSPFVFRDRLLMIGQPNTVTIREGKPSNNELENFRVSIHQSYMVGVFIVMVYNPESLLQKIKTDRQLILNVAQGKELIVKKQKEMASQIDGLKVEKLKVSIACPFSMSKIQTAVRGGLCTHPQCFSLETMLRMTYSSTHRKWRCPICKRKCFKIILDDYQQKVIESIKGDVHAVTFKENGDFELEIQVKTKNEQEELSSRRTKPSQSEIIIDEDEIKENQPHKKVKTSQPAQEIIEIDG